MFFKKKTGMGKKPSDRAKYLNEKKLRYVTVRDGDGVETVISRGGVILYRDGRINIYDGANVVFSCDPEQMDAGELMSLEGVVITAPDLAGDGKVRTVVAYYKYWREVKT